MIIKENQDQILKTKELIKSRKLKLEAKKRHLQNLVSKKTRLELEIKGTMRSLKRDLKKDTRALKESLNLNENSSSQELSDEIEKLAKDDSELTTFLRESTELSLQIFTLSQTREEILTPDDYEFFKKSLID